MAERGAHLTSASTTADRPSIFEVLAQESLMNVVRPALKHAVKVLAEKRPAQFGGLFRFYEEAYSALDLVLQTHFLWKYSGSFAENFYGLKRIPDDVIPPFKNRLPTKHCWKSLLCLVLLPYIKQKCDQKFEELDHTFSSSMGEAQSSIPRLYKVFLLVYPYLHSTWEGAALWYQLAYVFGKGRVHSPFLQMAGVELQVQSEDDVTLTETSDCEHPSRVMFWYGQALGALALTLSTSLSVGVFFLQFLDWWYTSETSSTSLTALPAPSPPQKTRTGDQSRSSHTCPLCQRSRTNNTVLSVSGFVFCYPCIYNYVKQNGCCPVTSYPSQTEHLVKLYILDT